MPFELVPAPDDLPPAHVHRWLECRFANLTVVGVYFANHRPKLPMWKALLQSATSRADRIVFMGDFNTGKHYIDEVGATFVGAEYFAHMEGTGYLDAWRSRQTDARDYTWWSNRGHGFRLDHSWMSPGCAGDLVAAVIDH